MTTETLMQVKAALTPVYSPRQFIENAPMKDYTSVQIGGPADLLLEAESERQICLAVTTCASLHLPLLVIGNGSNLLVRDGGLRGVVLHIGAAFSNILIDGIRLTAQAGASMADTAIAAQRAGLSGLEFSEGIPGTIGGGTFMNAGAYGGEMGAVVESVRAINEAGQIVTLTHTDMSFSYRHSAAQEQKLIIISVTYCLRLGNKDEIAQEMAELHRRRAEKQPLEVPSCGSTFKRPEGHFVGALVDECGLRGTTVGGAMVSKKHAGFLVNYNHATATDFLGLIALVQSRVMENSGIRLTPEVRILGEDTRVKPV